MFRIQHAAMRIACPHCQAAYEIDTSLSDAVFVCHRCGNSFQAVHDETPQTPDMAIEEQLPLFGERTKAPSPEESAPDTPIQSNTPASEPQTSESVAYDGTDTVDYHQEAGDEPLRQPIKRIWPWLVGVLLVVIASGFWLQKDAWLDNRWFRSTAINAGLPLALRDKDWRVIPQSVHAQWIIRDDGSRALVIEGRVENLLSCELLLPKIEVTFFAQNQPDHIVLSRLLEITLPPSSTAIRHAPFQLPDRDIIPVQPLGQRGFILVLDDLPGQVGDFALTARTQKRG